MTLADAEDNASQQEIREDPPVLVSNKDSDTWPPWPWPPWDGDDDDDDDDEDGGGKRVNKTLRAHELAKKIVKFERKLAQASLDLYAFYLLISKPLVNCHFQRPFARSNRNVQSCSSVQSHRKRPSDSFPYIFLCAHTSRLFG